MKKDFITHLLSLYFFITLSVFLQYYYHLNSIITAASLALLTTLIFSTNSHFPQNNLEARTLIYTGLFASMGSFIHNKYFYLHTLIVAIICYLLFLLFKNQFVGHGGKLGSLAFISTLFYFLMDTYVF